jgi:hypothetical protein
VAAGQGESVVLAGALGHGAGGRGGERGGRAIFRELQKMLLTELEPELGDDVLPELKQMPEADLERCLVSGCVAPISKQLTRSLSESDLEKQRAEVRLMQDEKSSVFAQLQHLLQPRLCEDGLTWDEAASLLAKLHINFLRQAVATGNVQPVLAKLKAGAYQQPAMRKVGSAENLPVLQKMLLTLPEPVYTN